MTEQTQPEKVHGDPVDPAADREVSAGDVAEDPNAPDEDGANPHLEPDDSDETPADPANIPDAHPANQPDKLDDGS
jgi:hypothetical protein